MGVINVTPDSFSDGGQFLSSDSALKHAETLISDGADILDIGGESTRPGAEPVSAQEEMDRVLPVVETLAKQSEVAVSIDTCKYEVAAEAVRLGARIINDISGGRDIRMAQLVARHQLEVILMHMQGTPQTMQVAPSYPRGVVQEVRSYLSWRVAAFEELGVRREKIWVDPGIGFGKTLEQNSEILRSLRSLQGIGHRLVIGASRKSFLAKILNNPDLAMEKRGGATLAAHILAFENGASVFRVHDVGEMKRALRVWAVLRETQS